MASKGKGFHGLTLAMEPLHVVRKYAVPSAAQLHFIIMIDSHWLHYLRYAACFSLGSLNYELSDLWISSI